MIYLEKNRKSPLYEQIYQTLKKDILTGQYRCGDKLPATRKLATEIGASRNTVDKAYQQLAVEGYLTATIGSGFTVNPTASLSFVPPKQKKISFSGQVTPATPFRYDFCYGVMDNSIFPHKQWRKSVNNALAQLEIKLHIQYPDRQGEMALRQPIADYLKQARGVTCSPEQIIITCGHQHSMEILANLFEKSAKRFAIEDPGYDGIRIVFSNHQYKILSIPVEKDGITTMPLSDLEADLLYLTPSHQFPTGAVLSIAKRHQLLQWAARRKAYLIEDDYDSELRYDTSPIPSLQALDPYDRVIYTGTFSKSLSPALRTAYMVLPPPLLNSYKNYYSRYNSQVPSLHQLALADFIANGSYERHLGRMRTFYRKRHHALQEAIATVFGQRAVISGEGAGLHLLAEFKTDLSRQELICRGEAIGIRLYSPAVNYMDPATCPSSQLMLGFATIPAEKFQRALQELDEVWSR